MTYTPYICDYCDRWGVGCDHGGCVGCGDRGVRNTWLHRKSMGWPFWKRLRYFHVTHQAD